MKKFKLWFYRKFGVTWQYDYRNGQRKVLMITVSSGKYEESWTEWVIGERQEPYSCMCSHCQQGYDCCGRAFCAGARNYFGGLVSVGSYGLNV